MSEQMVSATKEMVSNETKQKLRALIQGEYAQRTGHVSIHSVDMAVLGDEAAQKIKQELTQITQTYYSANEILIKFL